MRIRGMPLQDLRNMRFRIVVTEKHAELHVFGVAHQLFIGTMLELLRTLIRDREDVVIQVERPDSKESVSEPGDLVIGTWPVLFVGSGRIKDNEFIADQYKEGERLFASYSEPAARLTITAFGECRNWSGGGF